MKLFGRDINKKMAITFTLHFLIIIDIILITVAIIFTLPENVALDIQMFDFCVCVLLLAEWAINFHMSSPKTAYLKNKGNIITLIASIPFDAILPAVIPGISLLRYLRLLKLLRVIVLFNRFYNDFSKFISKTNLDKILVGLVFTVMLFTVLLWIFGSSNSLFDYFYFVIVTLTTVGYGDITPQTYNEKVITLALIIIGIFIFSTIPAALSSFLTERLLKKDAKKQNNAFEDSMRVKFESLENELETFHKENRQLREEIKELKEMIKEK